MKQDYNTVSTPIKLSSYGRNIQKMVDHCIQIEDRTERQRCAQSIIATMSHLYGMNKERSDYWQVLWDHLFIMSDFKLDIDYPYEVISREEYYSSLAPQLDNEYQKKPKFGHYGRNIERMIDRAIEQTDPTNKLEMTKSIAVQMKKSYLAWNRDNVSNAKIYTDLYELSKGQLYLDETLFLLPDLSSSDPTLPSSPAPSKKEYKKGFAQQLKKKKKK